MLQKIKSFWRFWSDPAVSKWFILRYGFGQLLAHSGLGRYLSFHTPHYRLYLTYSPVAMVLFGDPTVERDEEKLIEPFVRAGDIVIDIGANIGTFSLKAAKLVGETGQVFAFEPHPQTATYLARNVQLNQFKNVTVVPKALGTTNGEVSFSSYDYDDVNHVVEKGNGTLVPVVRLDEELETVVNKKIAFINIDVEGYELPTLQGAEKIISQTNRILFEAYEPNCARFNYTVSDLFNWFRERGFSLLNPVTKEPVDPARDGIESVMNVLAIRSSM